MVGTGLRGDQGLRVPPVGHLAEVADLPQAPLDAGLQTEQQAVGARCHHVNGPHPLHKVWK